MVTPEHRAQQGPTKRRRCEGMLGREAPSAPRRHSETAGEVRERACRSDVKVEVFASAKMSSSVSERPRLRSEIGEVRGSLKRITELSAREAAVQGGAGAAPSSSSSSQAAPRGTDGLFLVREVAVQGDAGAAPSSPSSSPSSQAAPRGTNALFLAREAAVQGVTGAGPSSSISQITPCGTNRLLLRATEPRPESASTAASKRRKTAASEKHNPEPDVLVRASYLKIRFAHLIAKSQETLSLRHPEDLKSRPATDADADAEEGSRGRDAEREMARAALQEVERNARHTGLSVETIHPADLMALGITAMEHIVSREHHRDRDGVLRIASAVHRRPRSPVEKLGLFVKADDGGDQEIEEGESR